MNTNIIMDYKKFIMIEMMKNGKIVHADCVFSFFEEGFDFRKPVEITKERFPIMYAYLKYHEPKFDGVFLLKKVHFRVSYGIKIFECYVICNSANKVFSRAMNFALDIVYRHLVNNPVRKDTFVSYDYTVMEFVNEMTKLKEISLKQKKKEV